MSNSAYLCCSDYSHAYPSERYKKYDTAIHTVACSAYGIPLLWLSMFREEDLKRQRVCFQDDNETIAVVAPVVETLLAVERLAHSLPILHALLARNGSLTEHADLLRKALLETGGKFVTVEWIEIVGMFPCGEAHKLLARIVKYFESPAEEMLLHAQRDAQRSIINQWPLVDKIRFLRTKTNHASLPEIKLALEQCNGNVFHVIEQFDSLRTHLERVAEENARLFAKADGKQLQDEPLLIADVIAQLTSLNLRYKFPTPAEMQNSATLTKEERYNYFHLLGTEFEQSVPW